MTRAMMTINCLAYFRGCILLDFTITREKIYERDIICCCSVAKLCLTLHGLMLHGLQHARLPCPSLSPGVGSNSFPLSWWYYPTISSSVTSFSSGLQSFPASGSFPVSQFFASGDQSIGTSASASVLPVNTQDWFPLALTSLISL